MKVAENGHHELKTASAWTTRGLAGEPGSFGTFGRRHHAKLAAFDLSLEQEALFEKIRAWRGATGKEQLEVLGAAEG